MPTLEVIVRDAQTAEPIAGAEVKAQYAGTAEPIAFAADCQGRCVVGLPEKPGLITILATAPGRAFLRFTHNTSPAVPPPASIELSLPLGEVVGGTVRDQAGHPIAGAKVLLFLSPGCAPKTPVVAVLPNGYAVTSDDQGCWRCDRFPSEAMAKVQEMRLFYQAAHPDFVSDGPGCLINELALVSARLGKADIVMKRGTPFAVRVRDAAGAAIAGARAAELPARMAGSGTAWVDADAAGLVPFKQVDPGPRKVVAIAPGFGPELVEVKIPPVGEQAPTFEITLKPGRTIRGRAVDQAGAPIEGVALRLRGWRGYNGLPWQATTDAQGGFTWPDAPLDEVELMARKEGYMTLQSVKVGPGVEMVDLRLDPLVEIAGRVIDAKTGKPIRSFRVAAGQSWSPESEHPSYIAWNRGPVVEDGEGRFRHKPANATPRPLYIRIEAPSYLPNPPRAVSAADASNEMEFRLEPTLRTAGVVVDPDDAPLEGVRLSLATPRPNGADIRGGVNRGREVEVKSDAQGFFELPSEDMTWWIVALHERGHAVMTSRAFFEGERKIILQPWGRLEGELRRGNEAWPETSVMFTAGNSPYFNPWTPRVQFVTETRTDAQGRFIVPMAPAIRGYMHTFVVGSRETGMTWRHEPVAIEPGQTTRITLGGTGQRVTGRVNWGEDLYLWVSLLEHARHPAREFHARQPLRYYSASVQGDGRFTIDDVPPGRYEWVVVGRPRQWDAHREVTMINSGEIVVGEAGPTIDMGDIVGEPIRRPAVGDPAPELALATAHAGTIRLADLTAAGKRVLVCFWDTQLTDKVPSLERLKRVLDETAARREANDVVVLGVDMNAATGWWGQPMPTLEASPAWNLYAVMRISEAKLRAAWGVNDSTRVSLWLVGKDGRIEAADLKVDAAAAAVG